MAGEQLQRQPPVLDETPPPEATPAPTPGLLYPTDAMSWGDFAKKVNYLDSTDDVRENQLNHFNYFNVQEMAVQAGLTNTDANTLRKGMKVFVPQWTQGMETAYAAQGGVGSDKGRNSVPDRPDTVLGGLGKATSRGFAKSYTETVSGVGDVGNIIARNFDSESEFGEGLSELGSSWTDSVNSSLASNKEGFGYEVAEAIGQIAGLVVGGASTGGLGWLAKGVGIAGKAGKALKAADAAKTVVSAGDAARATSTFMGNLAKTGVVTGSATAQQLSEFTNEYTASRAESGEEINVGVLNEILAASGVIGLLDSALPGRFLNVKYFDRARKALKDNPGILKYAGTGLVTEGLTEAGQKVIYNAVIKDTLIDEDRALIEGAIREGSVGGVTGMLLGALAGFLSPRRANTGTADLPDTGEGSAVATEVQAELEGLSDEFGTKFPIVDGASTNAPTPVPTATGDPLVDIPRGATDGAVPDRQTERTTYELEGENAVNDESFLIYNSLASEQRDEINRIIDEEKKKSQAGSYSRIVLSRLQTLLKDGSLNATAADFQIMSTVLNRATNQVLNPTAAPTAQTTTATEATPTDTPAGTPISDFADVQPGDVFTTEEGTYVVIQKNDEGVTYADTDGVETFISLGDLLPQMTVRQFIRPEVVSQDPAFLDPDQEVPPVFDESGNVVPDQAPIKKGQDVTGTTPRVDPNDDVDVTEEHVEDQANVAPLNPTNKDADQVNTADMQESENKKNKPIRNSVPPSDMEVDGAQEVDAKDVEDGGVEALINERTKSMAEDIAAADRKAKLTPETLTPDERKAAHAAAIKEDNIQGPSNKPSLLAGIRGLWSRYIKTGGHLQEIENFHQEQLNGKPDIKNAEGPLSQSERFVASLRASDRIVMAGLSDLNKATRQDYGKTVPSRDAELIDEALRGGKNALKELQQKAPATATVLAHMRVRISNNSLLIVDRLFRHISRITPLAQTGNGLSTETIKTNKKILGELWKQVKILRASKGRYIHRAYLFNSNKDFAKKALHDVELQKDARRFISVHYKVTHPRQQGQSVIQYNALVQSHTDAVILEIFDKVSKARVGNNVTNTDAVLLQQVSSFKDRTDVPASVRKMLGEIKDPSVNFATTIQQQELYLNSLKFSEHMINAGTKHGWMSPEPDSAKGLTRRINDDGSNPAILLMSGSYMSDNMAQGLVDYFHIDIQEGLVKHMNALTGVVKLGKTVFSPATAMRNWTTALWVMGVNGSFSTKGLSESFKLVYDTMTNQPGTIGGRKYHEMLTAEGVVGDGISHQSLVQMMKDLALYDVRTSDMFTATFDEAQANSLRKGSLFKSARDFQKFAVKFYQSADDFPKVIAFESNRKLLSKAYNKPIEDPGIIREAANRVKNTHFTYSKVPLLVKNFRGIPFSTPFISFPAEVVRTSKNWFKLMKEDLASGNPVLVRSAILRGMSATATGVVTENAIEKFGEEFGDVSPEDQVDGNESRSKFEEGTGLKLAFKHDDGTYEAVNMSRYNPYAMFSDAISAFNTHPDDELTSRMTSAAFKLVEPFVQEDITYAAVTEAISNLGEDSARSTEQDTIRMMELLGESMSPTALLQIYSAYKAYSGDTYDYAGGLKSPSREFAKLIGASSQLFNFNKNLQFAGLAYSNIRNDTTKEILRLAEDIEGFRVMDLQDLLTGMEYRVQKKWGYLLKDVEMMRGRGLSNRDIETLLKRKGTDKNAGGMLSSEEMNRLLIGGPAPRAKYPDKAISTIIQRVGVNNGPAAMAQVRDALATVKTQLGY